MDAKARKALLAIQDCLAAGHVRLLRHFTERMDQRGSYWGDAVHVIQSPFDVRYDGLDRYHRPKWILEGETSDGLPLEVVCATDRDPEGQRVVFITLYWSE